MSGLDDLNTPAVSVRAVAWWVGGLLLLGLGAGSLVLGFAGGVAFLALAVPPLVAGYAVLRQWRWARWLGLGVAAAYAAAVVYVATTPWRGLTPPAGQAGQGIDAGMAAIAAAFFAAGLLVLLGRTAPRRA